MRIELSHETLSQLIPWYANGTLSPEESAAVKQHLENCTACQDELKLLREVGAAMTDLADEAPAVKPSFDKALAAVERWERSKRHARFAWFSRLRERVTHFFNSWWGLTPLWPRAIIAVQALLVVGLAGTMVYEQHKDRIYKTSSAPSGDRSNTRIVISFNDNASEQQVQQVIRAVHGKIVDGPSALGLYTIQVPIPAERSAEIQEVLETLRKDDRVIRFAEQKP